MAGARATAQLAARWPLPPPVVCHHPARGRNNTLSALSRRKWLTLVSPLALAAALLPRPVRRREAAPATEETTTTRAPAFTIFGTFGAKGDGTNVGRRPPSSQRSMLVRPTEGGTVLVPAGTFQIGTTELKSNITLQLASGATLLGSGDGKQYHAVEAIPLRGDSTLGDGNWAAPFAVNARNVDSGRARHDRRPGRSGSTTWQQRAAPPPSGIGGGQKALTTSSATAAKTWSSAISNSFAAPFTASV